MSLINVSNLTFAYEGGYENIFENVSFQIDTSWKLGFTGRNGRGKTTFLNLLLGKHEYSGSISKQVNFEYFPYSMDGKHKTTINVINEILYENSSATEWMIQKELSLLDLPESVLARTFETLSGGEQNKILLACLFLRKNSFLLIDEPTNHLDTFGRETLGKYLSAKSGFILVSHDRAFLDDCIDHILSINRANIEVQKGNFSSWWENKRRNDEYERAKNKMLKEDIKHLSAAAKRTSEWSSAVEESKYMCNSNISKNAGVGKLDRGYIGHKSAKMMKRSKSIEARRLSAIEEKSSLLKNVERADKLKICQERYHARTMLSLNDVSVFYGVDEFVCRNISFTIEREDRVLLRGRNGSGKSSIIKLVCSENTKNIGYSGEFIIGSGLVVSYVPQDTSFLKGILSYYVLENSLDESLFKTVLRKLDFSRIQFEKDMGDWSDGQKKKVLLAKSLCKKAHLHVWDEPLNFIDVISRIQLEELILEFKPTMLMVEHDRAFCENVATKIIEL
jgi:lincosamide and streptogramin A transport system ATP-binding/permease protein